MQGTPTSRKSGSNAPYRPNLFFKAGLFRRLRCPAAGALDA